MKVQVQYLKKDDDLISFEKWEVKNIATAKRSLAKIGIVGSAEIFDVCKEKVYYYKPRK